MKATRYSTVVYRTTNLGDMIQTVAMTRLLPATRGVFRHRMASAPEDSTFVVNGFLEGDNPSPPGIRCLFAGASGPHRKLGQYLRWMAASPWPVGARDPFTVALLQAAGMRVEFTGCATLTFPRYDGPRSGVYSVDCEGPGTRLSHRISYRMPFEAQWSRALQYLEYYRTAEQVHTSRLHVALPCLAFGTPVHLPASTFRWRPERFSILEELGLPTEGLVEGDVSGCAARFRGFLERHLDEAIGSHDPIPPKLCGPDRIGLIRSLAWDLREFWIHAPRPRWPA